MTGSTKLTLEIPGDILDAVRLPPDEMEREFRKELALALYQRGALPLGKARRLAQMTYWAFDAWLGRLPSSRSEPQAAPYSEWKKPRRARGTAPPCPLSPGGEGTRRTRSPGRTAGTKNIADGEQKQLTAGLSSAVHQALIAPGRL